MAADKGPIVDSAMLRLELVRLRKASQLTQEDVARRLEWSPSKLIRIEGGRSAITKVDLDALLTQYGVTSADERDRLQDLNRGARESAWWDVYRNDISDPYLNYVGYEAGATFIRQFPGTVVPGLLQTEEYATALTIRTAEAMNVNPVVKLRLQRQAELRKREIQPYQYYILDEAVIRRRVGIDTDPAIMPNQLRHIAGQAAGNDLMKVRVIPFNAGAHAGLAGAFTLLDFDGGLPDLLYLDTGRGELADITGDNPRVADYRDAFEALLVPALPEDESIAFIRQAAEEMSLCPNNNSCPGSSLSSQSSLLSQQVNLVSFRH